MDGIGGINIMLRNELRNDEIKYVVIFSNTYNAEKAYNRVKR